MAAIVLATAGSVAGAQPASVASPPARVAATLPSESPLPSCLDESLRDNLGAELKPRGVQKRDFTKDGKLAVVARGGLYGGDLTSSAWLAGGAAELFFTEDFGIELSFDVTPVALDLDQPLAQFFGDDRFEQGLGYLGLANAVWSPIHAKVKSGGGIVHADVLLFGGAGKLFHDSVQGVAFDAGAALDLEVARALTIRLDLRNVMAVQEAAGETRLTNNLVATVGLAVWIPTGIL